MADNRSGRDEQADDAERRQRERELETELRRGDEPEPPIDDAALDELDEELRAVEFPATGAALVAAVGDHPVGADHSAAELLPDTDVETFESPAAVRVLLRRPTVATAMKRIVEAAATQREVSFSESQRDAYEKTFRELRAIDVDDDDEAIRAVGDWAVERVREDGALPGSRDLRRHAAVVCREYGYRVDVDEWLGV